MSVTITRLTPDDLSIANFIVEKLADTSHEKPAGNHLHILLADQRNYLLAASIENETIGYALAYRFPSLYRSSYLAYLYDIEVVAFYRRRGAGRLLIETLLTYLRADNVSELWLGTATDNIDGQALFTSTGGIKSGDTFNDFTYELA